MPISERYHDLEKFCKMAHRKCGIDPEKMDSAISFPINSETEVVKKKFANTEKEGEIVGIVDESMKIWEFKMGRIMHVFKHNDGVVRSARDGEFNRSMVKLALASYDGVSEIKNWAGDACATIEQKQEQSEQQK